MIALLIATAAAAPDSTRDALDRAEELLELRIDDGRLDPDALLPALLVSARPRYERSADWFETEVLAMLVRVVGADGLRHCQACSAPRAFVEDGRLAYQTGPIALSEVVRLDDEQRGDARPARSAIWVDENRGGVSIRVVDLRNGRVLYAQNVDPTLTAHRNSRRSHTMAAELERRADGKTPVQTFVDIGVYPQQHVSLDWTDQWGPHNGALTGFSVSLFDPLLGVGVTHAQRTPLYDTLVGAKLLVSIPTALARSVAGEAVEDIEILDPMITATGYARVPLGRSNYGAFASISTNGRIGIGVSLMNVSLLPVLP